MPDVAVFPLQGDDGPDVRGGSGDILLVHATETDRKGTWSSRAELGAQPGTALAARPLPRGHRQLGWGRVCRDPLSLMGCVYLWEMDISWISAWWFHLAAGMGLTPPSPCLDLEDEAHQ